MSGMKGLVGKKMSQDYKFMGEKVSISKLSVAQILEIQEASKKLDSSEDENAGLEVLMFVIKTAVDGANDLTEDDFSSFPMDELTKLSNAIMKFSGIDPDVKGN